MSSKGKIAILVESQYQVLEVWYPCYRLKEAGYEVHLLGEKAGAVYPSKEGYPAKADRAAAEARAEDYEGIVVPGGFAPDFMRRYPGPVELVKAIWEAGKVVAAICHGLWIPASAGILKGKRATCFYAIKDDIIHAGAEYVDQEVCVDGKLITSRKPDDLPAFMVETIKVLGGCPY